MNDKLQKTEQARKNVLKLYIGVLILNIIFLIASYILTNILNITFEGVIDDTKLYFFQLIEVILLGTIPLSIFTFNNRIKKANPEKTDEWCKSYITVANIRTAIVGQATILNLFFYTICNQETFLYAGIISLIAHIYIYPSKIELEKLLNGDTQK